MSNHIINNNYYNNYYACLYNNNIYSKCELENIHMMLTKNMSYS